MDLNGGDPDFPDGGFLGKGILLLSPATKLQEGNVFTPVCHCVYGGGVSLSRGSLSRGFLGDLCPGGVSQRVGGTYPAGMHPYNRQQTKFGAR